MTRICAGLIACWLLVASCGQPKPVEPRAPTFTHFAISPTVHTYRLPGSARQVASVVEIDGTHLLLCDYFDIFRLTRTGSGYTISRLPRRSAPWSPAGLAYRNGFLYVADNLGQDVLVLRLVGDDLELVQRITNSAMRSPQNVVVGPDGSIVVADYDGNGVLKFRADGSLLWRLPLELAHGVTESEGFIYATSGTGHRVSKIDQGGNVVMVAGSFGASPGRYLFPVGLAQAGERILVTDSVNGRITTLDRDLHVQEAVGANGPGMDALNYPYATLPVSDGYLIADTYKSRLVRTDRRWTIQEQIAFGPMVPTGRERPLVFATDERPSSYGMLPGVDVAAEMGLRPPLDFVGGFNGIDHTDAGGHVLHLDFGSSRVPYTLTTWAQKVGSAVVVGSPQSPTIEVIDPATGMFTFVEVGLDSWWQAGALLLSSNVRRNLSDVVAPALKAFSNAQQLLAGGASRADAYNKAVNGGERYDWSLDLTSEGAQQFLHSPMTKTDASRYYSLTLKQGQQRVTELLVVRYLSGG